MWRWETYVQLLIIAGTLLARSLELLAHLADLLVRLGEFGGRHFDCLFVLALYLLQTDARTYLLDM